MTEHLQAGLNGRPNQSVDGLPELQVPYPSILSVARRNTRLNTTRGVSFGARACNHPNGWPDPCKLAELEPPIERGEKCVNSQYDEIEFDPFQWYDLELADCYDPVADLQGLAEQTVVNGTSYILANELDSAPIGIGNPSLQSSAIDISGGNVLAPQDGLAQLLKALHERAHLGGILWGPYHAVPALMPFSTSRPTTTGFEMVGLPYGPGLSGNGPLGIPAETGAAWIYATTSYVEYNFDEPRPYDRSGLSKSERMNRAGSESFRRGIIRFNPFCVFATQICLTGLNCCAGSGDEGGEG